MGGFLPVPLWIHQLGYRSFVLGRELAGGGMLFHERYDGNPDVTSALIPKPLYDPDPIVRARLISNWSQSRSRKFTTRLAYQGAIGNLTPRFPALPTLCYHVGCERNRRQRGPSR